MWIGVVKIWNLKMIKHKLMKLNIKGYTTGLLLLAQLISIFLKLLGIIKWSWWLILSPVWVPVVVLVIVIIIKTISAMRVKNQKNKEIPIPDSIYLSIKIMRKCFGGTKVKLISEKMYRIAPDEYTPLGKLGVDIEIEGIKTFLGCESMAEEIACTPCGRLIAEEFIYSVIKKL